ncbi:MAG: WD40/YVTN/BNR-like repeat-containing protein, partial [Roseiflexaceae bacterium]
MTREQKIGVAIAILGVVVAILALFRDVFNFTILFPTAAPTAALLPTKVLEASEANTPETLAPLTPIQIATAEPPNTTSSPTLPTSWTQLGLVGEPIFDISSSKGVIYVATNKAQHGIFKSEDLGVSWHAVNNGLKDLDILQVEVSPENPRSVYSV